MRPPTKAPRRAHLSAAPREPSYWRLRVDLMQSPWFLKERLYVLTNCCQPAPLQSPLLVATREAKTCTLMSLDLSRPPLQTPLIGPLLLHMFGVFSAFFAHATYRPSAPCFSEPDRSAFDAWLNQALEVLVPSTAK